jgi:hypothetical protein
MAMNQIKTKTPLDEIVSPEKVLLEPITWQNSIYFTFLFMKTHPPVKNMSSLTKFFIVLPQLLKLMRTAELCLH